MTTAGASRPGAALGRRLGAALLTGGLVAGCGAADAPGGRATDAPGPRAGRAASGAPPSPSATPPQDLCARVVAYWSREALDGDTYGDYQSMGLSNGQYEILRAVVDAARPVRERDGREAAQRLVDREARRGCDAWYRDGGPGEGPWQ
ncbi:hypothetical protein [Streptomyces minutiscleroticus]|uniref:Uncharacterized protein n=1 Tax=Streptomyces minutiscleroticus TaxID=68238 RepID=A0A918K8C3_9ACTN|nr:hypothetical protein [Streptomyces minutiscleroticus]GGX54378.1 hypothetical protein GCM10010358_05510 [Streptomyces minutiscleroticus]